MGKVKFSAAVSEIRNKVGGVIYSRNRYGAYMRNYSFPDLITHPLTGPQISFNNAFKAVSQMWNDLTPSQRSEWQQMAAALKKTDVYGQQYMSTGFNYFMSANVLRYHEFASILSVPGPLRPVQQITSFTATCDVSATQLLLNITFTATPPLVFFLVGAGSQKSPTVNAIKGLTRNLASFNLTNPMPLNIWAFYVAAFGVPTAGNRIPLHVYVSDSTTGLRTQELRIWVDVVA